MTTRGEFCDTEGRPATDAFRGSHAHLIEASDDWVDRLVVNGSFQLGQTGGGFRTFWRAWKGDDSRLSTEGLRQAAGDRARRFKAHCEKHRIPWIEGGAGDIQYEIARDRRPRQPDFRGVCAVRVGPAPAPVWAVRPNQRDQIIEWRPPEHWPHVPQDSFQIVDPQWGHGVVRRCGDAPWGAQVIVNGHQWVERQARARKVRVAKSGHCCVEGTDDAAVDGRAAPPGRWSRLDEHSLALRAQLVQTFQTLGRAA